MFTECHKTVSEKRKVKGINGTYSQPLAQIPERSSERCDDRWTLNNGIMETVLRQQWTE